MGTRARAARNAMDESLIYAKTPKGVEEVAARSAQLSMISRRVLIMMDGRRTVDELSLYVRPGEIDGIITQLESAGLAERAGSSAPATVAPRTVVPAAVQTTVTPPPEEREVPAITLEEAKRRAVRELNDRLGPTAEVIAMRIEDCRTIDQFRERVREAERSVAAALGPAAAQEYLSALRRRP